MNGTVLHIRQVKEEYNEQSLQNLITTNTGKITVVVPLDSIGVTNWPVDIAEDYINALFVGETLAEFCKSSIARHEEKAVHFLFSPKDNEGFTKALLWLASAYTGDDPEAEQVYSHFWDFEANLEEKNLRFPDIADSYLANYVNGIEGFGDEDKLEAMYQKHPEWRFNFWRSFLSKKLNYDVYVSSFAWIIPHSLHDNKSTKIILDLLKKYAGFRKKLPSFLEAQWLSIGDLPPIVFNHYTMTSYPFRGIKTAQECARAIWRDRFYSTFPKELSVREKEIQSQANSVTYSHLVDQLALKLSEDGEILLASDSVSQYLFFKESYSFADWADKSSYFTEDSLIDTYVKGEGKRLWALPQRIQNQYLNAIDKIAEALSSLEGSPVDIQLPWNNIDDDKFEQLCYDIIGELEAFDPDTRRRMGKSHSRDGGRDIEVYSRKRIGASPIKWIVQCKFTKKGRSLSGAKVQVSDVLDQYGAGGFAVMTNAPIDSTLHDKLERIAYNRKIEFDEWDGMRIERLLARPRYRNIRARYLGR